MITFLSVSNVMMLLPLTLVLRDHFIPDLGVDANSYSNLWVVATSFFPTSELMLVPTPASELLSISLIPDLIVLVYPSYPWPRSCCLFLSYPTSELMAVPSPALELLSISRIPYLKFVVFLIPASELLSMFLISNLRVVTFLLSDLRVVCFSQPQSWRLSFLPQPQSCCFFSSLRVVVTFRITPTSELYVACPYPDLWVVVPFPSSELLSELLFTVWCPTSVLTFTILFPTSELSICFFPTSKLTFTIFRSHPHSWATTFFQLRSRCISF